MSKFISFKRQAKIRLGQYYEETSELEVIVNTDEISKIETTWDRSEGYILCTKSGDVFEISRQTYLRIKGILLIGDTPKERLAELEEEISRNVEERDHEPLVKLKPNAILKKKLANEPLRTWTKSRLRSNCIFTIGDLCSKTKIDLLNLRPFGRKALQEVIEYLDTMNLKLKDS